MRYRRADLPGGTYFFTVNLANRASGLLTGHVDALRNAVREVRQRHPFEIIAWVVLPDHMHAIWALPEDDKDYSGRWSLIKARFSRGIAPTEAISPSRRSKRERGIWQRRFWEHGIREDLDLRRHIDYIHINPVKHGHVLRAGDWPHSSIHRYIERGWLTKGWACEPADMGSSGECE